MPSSPTQVTFFLQMTAGVVSWMGMTIPFHLVHGDSVQALLGLATRDLEAIWDTDL